MHLITAHPEWNELVRSLTLPWTNSATVSAKRSSFAFSSDGAIEPAGVSDDTAQKRQSRVGETADTAAGAEVERRPSRLGGDPGDTFRSLKPVHLAARVTRKVLEANAVRRRRAPPGWPDSPSQRG
jgi:hypothetical protein